MNLGHSEAPDFDIEAVERLTNDWDLDLDCERDLDCLEDFSEGLEDEDGFEGLEDEKLLEIRLDDFEDDFLELDFEEGELDEQECLITTDPGWEGAFTITTFE